MEKVRNVIFEEDGWTLRRIVVFSMLIYCGATVWFILWRNIDNALYRDISNSLIILAGTISTGYIFGAIWDSNNRRRRRSDMTPGVYEQTTKTVVSDVAPPIAPIREEGP